MILAVDYADNVSLSAHHFRALGANKNKKSIQHHFRLHIAALKK